MVNFSDTMEKSIDMGLRNCHKKTPFPGSRAIQPSTSRDRDWCKDTSKKLN